MGEVNRARGRSRSVRVAEHFFVKHIQDRRMRDRIELPPEITFAGKCRFKVRGAEYFRMAEVRI